MAILKCKMCGGDLEVTEEMTVCECEYCGTKQTVPTMDNEKKITLFSRANRLLRNCEFDKAAGVYEGIVVDFPEEAEAYWGLVLCKYGIEYVDDSITGKKVPTCHRSSFDSIMDDENFDQVMENADAVARKVYREEAKNIENIRKGIIEVSGREEPYDIFVCYKETDENGERTLDSVLAQDIYDVLVEKGYRVFFSRITLEDKLGQEYEPYIFSALNSAKVMLAVGTDYEYYNAVWVKNEWSRFLALISAGYDKTLIPCYKNIDVYDIPKEFTKLQAQDLGKVGAVQDLIRGIDKIFSKSISNGNSSLLGLQMQAQEQTKADNTVQLGIMALNSGDIQKGIQYFEEAIKSNPNHVGAYLGLVRALETKNSQSYCTRLESFPLDTVEKYLKQNPEMLESSPVSLLDKAIRNAQSINLIKVILDAGANPNDDYVLYHAIISERSNKYELINLLFDYGANSNIEYQLTFGENKEMCTPLRAAIWNVKDVELAKLLISHNADVNYISKCDSGESWSLLDMAVRTDNFQMVQLLLEKGADPDSGRWFNRGYWGSGGEKYKKTFYCALSEAILVTKNIDVVKMLLKYGANPSHKYTDYSTHTPLLGTTRFADGEYESSCLKDAVSVGSSEMVDLLLKAGADTNTIYYSRSYEEHWNDPPNKSTILDSAKSKGNGLILALIQKAINKDNLKKEKESLQKELPLVNGMFANRRKKKIETRLVEIEESLKKLEKE